MHHVPCTAPICSPLAAAASGAAQFILWVRAGRALYGYYVKASLPVVSIPHVREIEPRLSRPRLCTYCAHVNGHIDTDAWRSYRERACLASHCRHRPPPRPALRFFLFSPLSLSLSPFHPVSLSRNFFYLLFGICHGAFCLVTITTADLSISLSFFRSISPYISHSLPLLLLSFPSPAVLSRLVVRFLRHASASASYCREDARRCRSSATVTAAIDVGRIRNFDTRRSLSRARASPRSSLRCSLGGY